MEIQLVGVTKTEPLRELVWESWKNPDQRQRRLQTSGSSHWSAALNTAASTMDQRWMIQPSKTSHKAKAATNMKMALIHLPWSSCPKPGMNKLQRAAMMLPDVPFPDMVKVTLKDTPAVNLKSAQRPSLTHFRRRVPFAFHGLGPFWRSQTNSLNGSVFVTLTSGSKLICFCFEGRAGCGSDYGNVSGAGLCWRLDLCRGAGLHFSLRIGRRPVVV